MQARGAWWPRSASNNTLIYRRPSFNRLRLREPDQLSYRSVSQDGPNSAAKSSPLQAQRLKTLTIPQIYRSTSTNPFVNLAIEHYLLETSHPELRILFLYTNSPCVVIGRNQNPWVECDFARLGEGLAISSIHQSNADEAKPSHHGREPIDFVRRRSGGGTVFHDVGNLNYSVIVPNDKDFARRTHGDMIVKALKSLGLSHPGSAGEKSGLWRYEEIKVNDRNDIVGRSKGQDHWFKVSGSAFKLTRLRALHHGTLLYSSPNIPKISGFLSSPARDRIKAMGVESVRSPVGNLAVEDVSIERLRTQIETSIAREWNFKYGGTQHITELDEEEVLRTADTKLSHGIQELMSPEWLYEQTPRYEFQGDIGNLKFSMAVKNGRVTTVRTGDSLLQRLCEEEVVGKKLHEITDWQSTLREIVDVENGKPIETSIKLLALLQKCFPPLPGVHGRFSTKSIAQDAATTPNSSGAAPLISRAVPGGGSEVEKPGENLVEEVAKPT